MCGICGIIDLTGQPIDQEILQRMADTLAHRGPDAEGKIRFGIKSPPTFLVLLLLLMCAIAPFAYLPSLAWQKVYDFFRYVYIYILVVLIITDEKKYKLFVYSICCCYLYLAWQAHFYFSGGRLDGVGLPDASDANMLAALILLIIPFLIQFILHGSKIEKLFALITLVPLVNVFIMCGSRGGFIGLVVEILVLMILELRKGGMLKTLFVGCLLFACVWGLMDERYKNRLLGLQTSAVQGNLDQNSAGRVAIWKEGVRMVAEYPFGAGGGGFMELSPRYLSQELIEKTVGKRAAHNNYLTILVEQGILGFILYASFFSANIVILLRIKNKFVVDYADKNSNSKIFINGQIVCLLSMLSGFLSSSFFIDRFYFESIYIFPAFIMVLQSIYIKNYVKE